MLVDLHKHPFSPEAAQSRAYIDQTFLLSGPDGGVTGGEDGTCNVRPLREGGQEAWDMLRRLRQKAWQKAGLDPDMLLVEPQATNICQSQQPELAADSHKLEANDLEFPMLSGPSIPSGAGSFPSANPTLLNTASTTSTSATVLNGVNPPMATENIDTSHDFDWEKWDAVFGQSAPLDEEGLNFECANLWHFDQ